MNAERFWQAVALAQAINAGRDPRGSIQLQLNLLAEALTWITLPTPLPTKKIAFGPTEAERMKERGEA